MGPSAENLKGKKIGVVGLGARSGVSMVRYLCSKGADVIAYDRKPESELSESLKALSPFSFEVEAGTGDPKRLGRAELLVVSPGVPLSQPFLSAARAGGVPVWSEVEFAGRRISAPILAVTGTNGKSTTTSLLAEILSAWGKKVFAGGNLGTPLIEAAEGGYDFVVAEISSFQLEAVETFHPRVGVLLNLSPNHLDRHGDMETYAACKERMFARMTPADRAVFNIDNEICRAMARRVSAPVWFFSAKENPKADVYVKEGAVLLPDGKKVSLERFQLPGAHNAENAAAASAAAFAAGCPVRAIEDGLSSFRALPHRLEPVGTFRGVRFINDSKSTTPESSVRAVLAFDAPVILIAGGRGKGAGYGTLAAAAEGRVKEALFFGEAASNMAEDFARVPHRAFPDLAGAFRRAAEIAEDGDIVLFSPANSSFDQYKDYEERGRHFVSLFERHTRLGGGIS